MPAESQAGGDAGRPPDRETTGGAVAEAGRFDLAGYPGGESAARGGSLTPATRTILAIPLIAMTEPTSTPGHTPRTIPGKSLAGILENPPRESPASPGGVSGAIVTGEAGSPASNARPAAPFPATPGVRAREQSKMEGRATATNEEPSPRPSSEGSGRIARRVPPPRPFTPTRLGRGAPARRTPGAGVFRGNAEEIVARAQRLPAEERRFVEQVFAKGMSVVEVSRHAGRGPRGDQKRLRAILKMMNDPLFTFLHHRGDLVPRELRTTAEAVVFRRLSLRQTASLTRSSLHLVRERFRSFRAIARVHSAGKRLETMPPRTTSRDRREAV